MAEKSTRIADQESGEYVATRDARENDGGAHARVIQLIDIAQRELSQVTLRGVGAPISSADSIDLTNSPAELISTKLTVGDKTTLIIDVEHVANDGDVSITPIFFNVGGTVIGIGTTKTSAMGTAKFRMGASSGNYKSPRLEWDLQGAAYVGVHITVIGGSANGVVLKGGLI